MLNKTMNKQILNVQEAADFLRISTKTLRRWDKQGRLKPHRHPINRYRIYNVKELRKLLVREDSQELPAASVTGRNGIDEKKIEDVCFEIKKTSGVLLRGENLSILEQLAKVRAVSGKIKLVYIDPPYATKQSFFVSADRSATISRPRSGILAYKDNLAGQEYLEYLEKRLFAIKRLMAPDASIYLHIDYKIGHYVKCMMDKVFGQENFLNDITRIKCNPKNFSRAAYGNIKDMVLFYSMDKRRVWNDPRQKIELDEISARFNKVDLDGRRYTTTPLHAPGETANGPTGKKWRNMSPPSGRHWRYAPDELERLDKKDMIEWSSTGNPRKKIFEEDVLRAGIKMQDVWVFKDPQTQAYPTAKNLEMLKMIVEASSNPGDLVLDAFCGSGTTLLAANELGRRWIGIDSSPSAMEVCKSRLPEARALCM